VCRNPPGSPKRRPSNRWATHSRLPSRQRRMQYWVQGPKWPTRIEGCSGEAEPEPLVEAAGRKERRKRGVRRQHRSNQCKPCLTTRLIEGGMRLASCPPPAKCETALLRYPAWSGFRGHKPTGDADRNAGERGPMWRGTSWQGVLRPRCPGLLAIESQPLCSRAVVGEVHPVVRSLAFLRPVVHHRNEEGTQAEVSIRPQ